MSKFKLKPHHPRSSNGNGHITRSGHTMLQQDIVAELQLGESLEKERDELREKVKSLEVKLQLREIQGNLLKNRLKNEEGENDKLKAKVEGLETPFFIIWLNEIDQDIIEPTFVRNMCCIKIKSIIGEELFLDGIEEFLECHRITLSDEGIELEVSVAITEKGQFEYEFEYNGG